MPWEPLDHTGDLGVVVTAASLDELFAEAARALTDCVTEIARVGSAARRRVRLTAPDAELLLVDWLGEVLFRFDAEGFVTSAATVAIRESGEGGGLELTAELAGEPWDDARHPLKVPLKAVTYHGLEIGGGPDGWRARVIFDI